MIIFRLGSPMAAVFELSVCTGLISVLFISTISLTEPRTSSEKLQHKKERLKKFWYLPLIIVILGLILSQMNKTASFSLPAPDLQNDARSALWGGRPLDLLGQIIVLLVGVFGVVVLFKERKK
jgi:NADH-quinone oxidoreductase subunit J